MVFHTATMVLMTKFNGSSTASRWLCILKEKLGKKLSSGVWLKQADTRFCGCTTSLAEQTPEVIQILAGSN